MTEIKRESLCLAFPGTVSVGCTGHNIYHVNDSMCINVKQYIVYTLSINVDVFSDITLTLII